jgi:tRNA (guanine-N7-)-methyltransferase
MTDEQPHRHGAFFGRRKGHPLRARQVELFATLLPRLALDLGAPAPRDLAALFPLPVEDVRLEIGFGGAEHLIAQAQANPHTGFIGCEPFVNGMAKALVAIDALALANIRLHHGDAVDLLGWLPAGSTARVDLLYLGREPRRARAYSRARWRIPLRDRLGELCRMDDAALVALARFHLGRRARRRLAQALAGLFRHAL